MGIFKWGTAAFIVFMPVLLAVAIGFGLWYCCSNAKRLKRRKSERVSDLSQVLPADERENAGEAITPEEGGDANANADANGEGEGEKVVHVVEVKTEE